LLRFKAHDNVVRAVAFSTDGRSLITGSVDHTARVRNAFAWQISDYPGDSRSSLEERLELYKAQYWSDAIAKTDVSSRERRRIVARVGGDYNIAIDKVVKNHPSQPIPARDNSAGPSQIDLSEVYNAALSEAWQPTDSLEALGQDLTAFPAGLQRYSGILFDARGVVQLCSSHPDWSQFPNHVEIPINCCFDRLHVLHSVSNMERDRVIVGVYRLAYIDGTKHDIEIQYGRDLRDWWSSRDPEPTVTKGMVAWEAPRPSAFTQNETVRLFSTTYANPRPEVEVVRVHFISKATQSAPFLLALTIE
jgi:hypothetical protein